MRAVSLRGRHVNEIRDNQSTWSVAPVIAVVPLYHWYVTGNAPPGTLRNAALLPTERVIGAGSDSTNKSVRTVRAAGALVTEPSRFVTAHW